MTLPRFLAAATLAATCLLSPASAQEAAKTPVNAAVEYWRAGYATMTVRQGEKSPLGDIVWADIGANLDPAKMPEAYQNAKPFISQEAIVDFIKASHRTECDFVVPIENGPMTLMPHLGVLRTVVRAVRYDAREQLIAGNPDAAAERLAAIYRASGHLSGDGIMISSLVAAAMASSAHDEAKTLIGSGRLTEKGRQDLLDALGALDAKDPYNLLGAIRGEQRLMLGWVRQNFQGSDASSRFAKEVPPMLFSAEEKDQKLIEAISMMREEQFKESIEQTARFYDELIAAWQSDVVASRLATLDARVKKGDFGPMAVLLGPSLQKAHDSSEKAFAAREEILNQLNSYRLQPPAKN
jgi:hypothetical protein